MDALLAKLGVQAVNYAIRSGIALTSTFAIQQCTRLMKTVDDKGVYLDLKTLQKLLDSKIKIISPTIDLIEFKSGRGNVFLESAVPLAKSLHRDIVGLGRRLEQAAEAEEGFQLRRHTDKNAERQQLELQIIVKDIKDLLARIDRDIPLLQLAITASGESLSTALPPGVSPSRLLQASTFLTIGDTQYAMDSSHPVQIGPTFSLSLYMLFVGHTSQAPQTSRWPVPSPSTPQSQGQKLPGDDTPYGFGEGERKPVWQEVIHKARVRLCRTPLDFVFDDSADPSSYLDLGSRDEFAYHIEIIEDLNDGRVHDGSGEENGGFDDMPAAGIRESIAIHQISKIFYTDTGRILNIGSKNEIDNNPVLLLKRDVNAAPPLKIADRMFGFQGRDPEAYETDSNSGSEREQTRNDESDKDYQSDIDRQVLGEGSSSAPPLLRTRPAGLGASSYPRFPNHVDPEWLALEVFVEDEDEDDGSEDTLDEEEEEAEDSDLPREIIPPLFGLPLTPPINRTKKDAGQRERWSLDSKLLVQIRNLSLRSSPASREQSSRPVSRDQPDDSTRTRRSTHSASPSPASAAAVTEMGNSDTAATSAAAASSFVARSPFGAIASSLSLLEMLVRLTSLQAFQQASHLSIPDHVLTFFLEETSTTGLHGEDRWRARNEARRRVGFDPYTDTPAR